MPRPLTTAILLASGLFAAGCWSKEAASPFPAASVAAPGRKLIEIGGIGSDATTAFESKARAIRIEYRLVQMPADRQIAFVVEKEEGRGLFQRITSVTVPLSDRLTGSKTIPVLPGRYRLRVETDVSWSAKVYEASS